MKYPILLLLVTGLFIWSLNLFINRDYAGSEDASLYGTMARNITEGQGPLMGAAMPIAFTYPLPTLNRGWPSFYNYFYAYIIAGFFTIFGVNHFSLILITGFFYLATIPVLYYLVRNLRDGKTAIIACIWYIFSPAILAFSLSGMTESLFTFLITLCALLFFTKIKRFFQSGLAAGLAYLTRPAGILLIPALLIFCRLTEKRKAYPFYILAGFFVPYTLEKLLLPITVQGYADFSNNYTWIVIASTLTRTPSEILNSTIPVTIYSILPKLHLIAYKAVTNCYFFLQSLADLSTAGILFLYFLSFIIPDPKKINRYFRYFTLALLSSFLLFHFVVIYSIRFIQPLIPLLVASSSVVLVIIMEALVPKKQLQGYVLFTLIFIFIPFATRPGLATSVQRSLARPQKPTILQLLGNFSRENTGPGDIIVSDRAAQISWYAGRRAIFMPYDLPSLNELSKKVKINSIILSDYFPEHNPQWQDYINNPHDLGNYKFYKSFFIKAEDNYYRIPVKAVMYVRK